MVKCILEEENSFYDEQRKENKYICIFIYSQYAHIQGISKVLLKTLGEHCPLPKQGQMFI